MVQILDRPSSGEMFGTALGQGLQQAVQLKIQQKANQRALEAQKKLMELAHQQRLQEMAYQQKLEQKAAYRRAQTFLQSEYSETTENKIPQKTESLFNPFIIGCTLTILIALVVAVYFKWFRNKKGYLNANDLK